MFTEKQIKSAVKLFNKSMDGKWKFSKGANHVYYYKEDLEHALHDVMQYTEALLSGIEDSAKYQRCLQGDS